MTRTVVLAGAGHTHALVLDEVRRDALDGARVTVISASTVTHYSGMLPGLVAGLYGEDEVTVDVAALTGRAGATFIQGEIVGVDRARRQVKLADGREVGYDLLSLNVGAAPSLDDVVGAREHVVPVRPFGELTGAVARLRRDAAVVIVGGGAAGVELAFALRARLGDGASLTLVDARATLLPGFGGRAHRAAAGELEAKGVRTRLGAAVTRVERDAVHLAGGDRIAATCVVWATGARPPAWLAATGLATTEDGSVRVEPTLRTVTCPRVFAVGDAAAIEGRSVPKSGVYAVREAPILLTNLRRALRDEPLVEYRPQASELSLLGLYDGRAFFLKRRWPVFTGRWVMRLKRRIDRAYVAKLGGAT